MGNMAARPEANIVPHSKTPGIDICGDENGNIYIIRSDLHCYMKCSSSLNAYPGQSGFQQKYEVLPLHPACAGGDHYLNVPWPTSGFFIIIKGDHFIVVDNLCAPSGGFKKTPLSDFCKGGDHYLYDNASNTYYIVKGEYFMTVSDLTSPTGATSNLAPSYAEGLFFYGTKDQTNGSLGIVTQNDIGVLFTRTDDLSKAGWYSMIYPNLVDFLPGGISANYGAAMPKWVLLKSFTNSSKKMVITWSEKINKTVGFNKTIFKSLEKSWSVNAEALMGTNFEASLLVKKVLTQQFKLPPSFGGVGKQTEQEDWSEAYTTVDEISVSINPGQTVYVWQFRIGFRDSSDVLFCRDLQFTNSPVAPTALPPLCS